MLEDYINPGDKVELQVIQGAFAQKNEDAGRIYKSQITDICLLYTSDAADD